MHVQRHPNFLVNIIVIGILTSIGPANLKDDFLVLINGSFFFN